MKIKDIPYKKVRELALHFNANTYFKTGPSSNCADFDLGLQARLVHAFAFVMTPQGGEFWNLVSVGEFGEARKLNPGVFDEEETLVTDPNAAMIKRDGNTCIIKLEPEADKEVSEDKSQQTKHIARAMQFGCNHQNTPYWLRDPE